MTFRFLKFVSVAAALLLSSLSYASVDRELTCAFDNGFAVSGILQGDGFLKVSMFSGVSSKNGPIEYYVVGTGAGQTLLQENPISSYEPEGGDIGFHISTPHDQETVQTCNLYLPRKVPVSGSFQATYECGKFVKVNRNESQNVAWASTEGNCRL